MDWGSFFLVVFAIYAAYYFLILLIDSLKSTKSEKESSETFVFESGESETVFLDIEDSGSLDSTPLTSATNSEKFNFNSPGKGLVQSLQQEQEASQLEMSLPFSTITDQGIPVEDFRRQAKSIVSSIRF